MNKIQIFVMTRNRPDTIVKTIDSIINQTCQDFDLIISDNSTNNLTRNLLLDRSLGNFEYIRRNPSFESGIDHLNAIHSEATAEYYMIFHDDDIMMPNMVETLFEKIKRYSDALAIGTNAYRVKIGNKRKKKLFYKNRKDVIIDTPDKMLRRYVDNSIAPFPSYLYKNIGARYVVKENGGKYADVAFLVSLCNNGSIVLCKEPLMEYMIHKNQDSHINDFIQYMKLVNFLKTICKNRNELAKQRVKYIYYNMKQNISHTYPNIANLILMKYSFSNFYIKYKINRLLYILNKWKEY